jgi:two-component system sensor kinase FixL
MPELDKSILNQILSENVGSKDTIRDAKARLNALLDAAVNGLVIIDEKENIELFNNAAQLMFYILAKKLWVKKLSCSCPPF